MASPSQLARQGAHWAVHLGNSLRGSVAALLDVASVRAWWHWQSTNPQARSVLGHVAWSLLAALLPALVLEWLARRLLRRAYTALAARRERGSEDGAPQAASARAQGPQRRPPTTPRSQQSD